MKSLQKKISVLKPFHCCSKGRPDPSDLSSAPILPNSTVKIDEHSSEVSSTTNQAFGFSNLDMSSAPILPNSTVKIDEHSLEVSSTIEQSIGFCNCAHDSFANKSELLYAEVYQKPDIQKLSSHTLSHSIDTSYSKEFDRNSLSTLHEGYQEILSRSTGQNLVASEKQLSTNDSSKKVSFVQDISHHDTDVLAENEANHENEKDPKNIEPSTIFNVDSQILNAIENMNQMILYLKYELENEKLKSKMLEEKISAIQKETISSTL